MAAPSDQDYPSKVPTPLEVALASSDEVIHLLVALGAEVNAAIRDTVPGTRMTYLEYARLVLSKVGFYKASCLAPANTAGDAAALDAADTSQSQPLVWKVELEKIIAVCNIASVKQNDSENKQNRMFVDEIRDYFDDVDKLLTANGGKTATELYTLTDAQIADRERSLQTYVPAIPGPSNSTNRVFGGEERKFYRHTKSMFQAIMRSSLVALYEELFDACYAGDNVKIQQLCMPHGKHKSSDTPLQISVHWGNQWQGMRSSSMP